MHRFSDLDINPDDVHQDQGSAYLVGGDNVDAVTKCGNETFVRYHGPTQVSVGWVDSNHLKEAGTPHVPLPSNADAVCGAVQSALNAGRFSEAMPSISLTPLDPRATGQLQLDSNYYASGGSRVVVQGVVLNLVSITSVGTDHSNEILVWSKDFKKKLSPSDRDARDALNNGADDWGFGISESLVKVLGQPMVLGRNAHEENFSLSSIDRSGDIVPVCDAKLVVAPRAIVMKATDRGVCDAVAKGAAANVEMDAPGPDDRLAISNPWISAKRMDVPDAYVPSIDDYPRGGNYPRMDFMADFGSVTLALLQSGVVDLDNSGKKHHVGVISYEYASGAGAGSGGYSETPVLFDDKSVADPTKGKNALWFKQLGRGVDNKPSERFHARLVTYGGVTYVEYLMKGAKLPSQLWKVNSSGAQEVCNFKTSQFEVHLVTDRQ
ncbi:MAG TPA: hypothetical protein VME63_12180 [Dyella sp.]|uniref:hypothetical protein n=1 Tax=Dyella sp. TaxID=1869338 RepID=UPI002BFB9A8C|nr:hypothetical protein [Dyella sp.]HTV86161.1 hypothetical protein [Dyella sp.]